MPETKKYKICIVGSLLAGGGAERAHSNLTKYFHSKGIEVYNVIFEDRVEYEFAGELLNIGQIKHDTIIQKLRRFRLLSNYIKNHQFDYIIDLRYRGSVYAEYFLSRRVFRQAKYIPSIRGAYFPTYFTRYEAVAKRLFKKAYKIVAVSKEMEKAIRAKYGYQNITTIYNIVDTPHIRKLAEEPTAESLDFRFVLGLGRMHESNVKQQDVMIKAYAQSVLPKHGIKLLLVGDGTKLNDFKHLVEELNLTDKVVFTGFKENPYPYLKKAEFMLLTSKSEGFPNVILESFACETPVVSYDCKTGPSEIITHQHNGLLVEDQNIDKLIKVMNQMVEDEKLYQYCKSNTLPTAFEYSPDKIGQQWLDLMQIKI